LKIKKRKQTKTNVEDVGGKGNLIHCCWEYKLIQPLWKTICKYLIKLKIELPYDPTIPLLGIYLMEYKSGYNNKQPCLLQHYSQ
jgi:hypothetical protein